MACEKTKTRINIADLYPLTIRNNLLIFRLDRLFLLEKIVLTLLA